MTRHPRPPHGRSLPRRKRTALGSLTAASLTATALAIGSIASGSIPAAAAATPAAGTIADYSGTLPDGATWKAEIPPNWNGTLLLYSHGYLPTFVGAPNVAYDAPDPATGQALLAEGYGLAGSSYAAAGWALKTAPRDQLDALAATVQASGRRPHRVLAVGTSMGGLVTAKLAETAHGRIQGALTTCGMVAGVEALNNYQLDGEHAITQLLAPEQSIKLVGFTDIGEAFATTNTLITAVQQAQTTPEGRARVALAAALYQESSWGPGQAAPPAHGDAATAEAGQYAWLLQTLQFVTPGRFDIETAAGGNPAWNAGVDYRRLMSRSIDLGTVKAMYRTAGLDLNADLDTLTRTATITADPQAAATMFATSVPTGRLQMPVLDLHTVADQLIPVQQENAYRTMVQRAGRGHLLRQAYVESQGHCNFTPAELVAGVHALDRRVATGHWLGTSPQALQQAAQALDLGGSAFIPFRPGYLLRAGFPGEFPPGQRHRH